MSGKLNHRFYNKTKKEQNRILILIAICSLTIISISIFISFYSELYFIGIIITSIVLSIVAPFFDVPSLIKSGKMNYYSPLFLSEKPKNGIIKIHGGTLFDYVFVIDEKMNGKQRKILIIQQYLSGLLLLIEEYRDNKQLKIRGTSYIINEKTAEKIGFKLIETNTIQKAILIFNFFNIMISKSIANKKLSFPNLSKTRTFEAEISQLIENKRYIEKLNESLKRAMSNSGNI